MKKISRKNELFSVLNSKIIIKNQKNTQIKSEVFIKIIQ